MGEVRSKGLELEATAALSAAWDLRASYAFNETERRAAQRTGWKCPTRRAIWPACGWTAISGNGLRAGGGIRHIGERKGDFGNTFDLDSVTLVDLAATIPAATSRPA